MESLGATLRQIAAKLRLSTEYPKDGPSSEASPKPCSRCRGLGWLSVPHGEFSSCMVPCALCHTGKKQDWFADLHRSDGNSQAIDKAKAFANSPSGWLVLVGAVGTGKTRLLNAVLSQWRGSQRQALTAAELLDYWRHALDMENFGPVFNGYCTAPAFALDDLGAERPTEWGLERLTMFLDFRYARALPTLIATNYEREEMAKRLGERIADRVFDNGTGLVHVVTLDIPSFRTGRG